MSLIEPAGAASFARGGPGAASAFAARSGEERAQTVQSASTTRAAAPIESSLAVIQAQAAEAARMAAEQRPAQRVSRRALSETASRQEPPTARDNLAETADKAAANAPSKKQNLSLAKPMTAVILHELRLQQELADVQEEMQRKAG